MIPALRSRWTPDPRWALRITVPPVIEPVSVEQVKAMLGITTDTKDAAIGMQISIARTLAEEFTGRAFVSQTIQYQIDRFPPGRIPWWDGTVQAPLRAFVTQEPLLLPRPPLVTLTSVQYYDESNTLRTIDPNSYYVDAITEPARVVLKPGVSWPSDVRDRAAVLVTYVAGYGANSSLVPLPIQQAIIAHVSEYLDRPNVNVVSESIDNASVTYGGKNASSSMTANGGLRGDAVALLGPYRVIDTGL
jgi:uncharacterized phiE125 gp8 family phage protein